MGCPNEMREQNPVVYRGVLFGPASGYVPFGLHGDVEDDGGKWVVFRHPHFAPDGVVVHHLSLSRKTAYGLEDLDGRRRRENTYEGVLRRLRVSA